LFAREAIAPERVAQLGHGGFLMLEYQKSLAAAPKPRNGFSRTAQSNIYVAVCGHKVWAGDDFWYSSMRNLPMPCAHSEPRSM
jgi:hypothetical protein